MTKSMIETAYDIVKGSNQPVPFSDLMIEIGKRLDISQEDLIKRAGNFYTDLTLDGRFLIQANNSWDLRERHTSAEYLSGDMEIYTNQEDENPEEETKGLGEENESDDSINKAFNSNDDDNDANNSGNQNPGDIFESQDE